MLHIHHLQLLHKARVEGVEIAGRSCAHTALCKYKLCCSVFIGVCVTHRRVRVSSEEPEGYVNADVHQASV